MMRLYSAPPSPFGRKVKITARVKGLMDGISVEHADTRIANPTLAAANPLSKIPALVLADGTQLYDSGVICEYLDSLAPDPVLFPPTGIERYRCLTRAALADGIMEAALLMVYEERYRPADKWVPEWIARQQAKVDAGLASLEAAPPAWTTHPDYSHITLACALGYLDLRFDRTWRKSHPGLVAWLNAFSAKVPAFDATQPVA
jgi:glutathione S-transferase